MRYGTLAVLMLVAAVLWNGCCKTDKMCVATNTLNGITLTVKETQVTYRKVVKDRLLAVATEERNKRTVALQAAACPLDPKDAVTDQCKMIVEVAKGRYEGRKLKLVEAGTKLDAATGLVSAALDTAIDLLIVVRDGAQGKWPELAKLVAEAVRVGQTLADAWADFKKNAATY
jgi:hypothetical protein